MFSLYELTAFENLFYRGCAMESIVSLLKHTQNTAIGPFQSEHKEKYKPAKSG
jgi:hypothetical protein